MKIINILIISFFLNVWCCVGQNMVLENELKKYFGNIPILQSTDSIYKFALSNASLYEINSYRDSITSKITEFDIDYWYYEKDTIYKHIYYRTQVPLNGKDTIGSSIIGITINTKTLKVAKENCKRLINQYKKLFAKETKENFRNNLIGGIWQTTSLFLNENDKFPCVQITWYSAVDLMPDRYSIHVIKLDSGNKL